MQRIERTATNIIAVLTAVAWIVAALSGYSAQANFALGFIPLRLTQPVGDFAAVPAFLTPLTATLAHSGLVHLGFNLLMLVWCGTAVERVIGPSALIVLYLVGAYAAAGAQWALDPSGTTPMIGASGAISAVVGAFALSFGRARAFTSNLRINRWINVLWLLIAWIVLQVMMGWLAGGQGYLLATPAHVGGFAAGLLLQRPLLLWRYRSA
ncbi:MAG: rhomboid family intramembrane serine protease [Sphingomicrobium sp.]